MQKVFEILRKAEPKKGDYGIEIEAEGENLKVVNNKWWGTHDDGSLRGHFPDSRAEYVLNEPVLKRYVRTVLKSLVNDQKDAKFNFSFRTSVHVHMNVQELTFIQVLNVIYTYLLLEEPFLTFCGKGRKGNRFCLRLQDAEGLMDFLTTLIQGGEGFIKGINQENVRYASINVGALPKYGSLEFRGMRGTMDVEVIGTWVDALHKVREFAKGIDDPFTIYELFREKGAEGFMKLVLGDVAKHFQYDRVSKDVERSYSLSLDFPFVFKKVKDKIEKQPIGRPDIPLQRNLGVPVETVRDVREQVWEMLENNRPIPGAWLDWMKLHDRYFHDWIKEVINPPKPEPDF